MHLMTKRGLAVAASAGLSCGRARSQGAASWALRQVVGHLNLAGGPPNDNKKMCLAVGEQALCSGSACSEGDRAWAPEPGCVSILTGPWGYLVTQ